MNAHIFNVCLLIGWLLVLAGGMLLNLGAGLAAAGLLLIVLTVLAVRIAGGVYMPNAADKDEG